MNERDLNVLRSDHVHAVQAWYTSSWLVKGELLCNDVLAQGALQAVQWLLQLGCSKTQQFLSLKQPIMQLAENQNLLT